MRRMRRAFGLTAVAGALALAGQAEAQTPAPSVVDPKLEVRTVTTGLVQPVQMQFLKDHDFLVLEKASGLVKRFNNGAPAEVVLDLPVNSNSERGLLGIALDKNFKQNGTVFLYWSESTTGADSTQGAEVPLLGNRLDRFHWNGSTLVYEKTLHRNRAFQEDATNRTNPAVPLYRGNHNGGVVRVGPDGKVYLIVGDTGRRGQLQNLIDGPFGEGSADDQFGGPDPVNDHRTGSIIRLEPGVNSGWTQVMGPLERVAQFKAIETTRVPNPPDPNAPGGYYGLQQVRWDPINIADNAWDAYDRLF